MRKNAAMARNASKTSPLGDHTQLCFWDGSLVVIGFSYMLASYDRRTLARVGSAALYSTPPLFSKHHAMSMRLTDSGEVFPINRHNIPRYDKLSLEPYV
jgi:hypothetical protein